MWKLSVHHRMFKQYPWSLLEMSVLPTSSPTCCVITRMSPDIANCSLLGIDEGTCWYKLLNSDRTSSWFPQAGKTPTDLVQLWQADTRNALEHPEPAAEQNGLEGAAESRLETPSPVPAQ